MKLIIQIPNAPRSGEMTDEEYEVFAEGWEHVEDAGGTVIGGTP